MSVSQDLDKALNRLAKWRNVFAGWQLGTRPKNDPECQAVKDHREATIMLRAELSALIQLMINEGVFTEEDFQNSLLNEIEILDKNYEVFFPGFKTKDYGVEMTEEAVETTKHWKP